MHQELRSGLIVKWNPGSSNKSTVLIEDAALNKENQLLTPDKGRCWGCELSDVLNFNGQ